MFNLLKPLGPSRAPANQSPNRLPKPKIGFQNPKLSQCPKLASQNRELAPKALARKAQPEPQLRPSLGSVPAQPLPQPQPAAPWPTPAQPQPSPNPQPSPSPSRPAAPVPPRRTRTPHRSVSRDQGGSGQAGRVLPLPWPLSLAILARLNCSLAPSAWPC